MSTATGTVRRKDVPTVGTPASIDQAMDRFRIASLVGAAAFGSAAISSFHRRPAVTPVAVPVALVTADAAA